MIKITIEKNIPLPYNVSFPWKEMNAGDSFKIKNKILKLALESAKKHERVYKNFSIFFAEEDDEIRIWVTNVGRNNTKERITSLLLRRLKPMTEGVIFNALRTIDKLEVKRNLTDMVNQNEIVLTQKTHPKRREPINYYSL